LDVYSVSSLKQQCIDRNITSYPLRLLNPLEFNVFLNLDIINMKKIKDKDGSY